MLLSVETNIERSLFESVFKINSIRTTICPILKRVNFEIFQIPVTDAGCKVNVMESIMNFNAGFYLPQRNIYVT